MNKLLKWVVAAVLCAGTASAFGDQVMIIDAQYSTVTQNVRGRLEAAGHTVSVTTSTSGIPTGTGTYQQVWDLRYSAALTAGEVTNYTQFVTNGGFAYFVTENPGCCMARNNSVAALVTGLGGGTTQIGPGWANNVETNVNTTYMTSGITVNYLAVAAIVNSQGIPLISDASNSVSGMSWIGRAGALSSGVTGTIVTVADTNWLAEAWGTDNQTALDDIIRGIVAGTVGGTISASGNGAAASNGAAQQQAQNQTPPPPPTYDHANTGETVAMGTLASGAFTGDGGTLVGNGAEVTNNITLNAGGLTYDANNADSTISGVISGNGGIAFTGSGITTLSGVNTYTGVTGILSGASLVNTGSIASSSVVNNGTFTNIGTAGSVTNYGVFSNSGTAGGVINGGTFTNTGTVGIVANSGTMTNSGLTGDWSNWGTVSNNGTMGSGDNYLTFTNVGTIGAFTNTSDLTNTGTTGNGINTGRLINSGAMGIIANSGSFLNTGTLSGINNSGTWSTTSTTLQSYTQSGAGSTVLDYSTRLRIAGSANLDGNLTLAGNAPGLGKYSLIQSGGINGTYSSYTGVGALRYTASDVQLWVMPSSGEVQRRVDSFAQNLGGANSLASGALTGGVGSDCAVFGDSGGCMNANYGATRAAGGDLNSTGITLVKKIDSNWRVGVFANGVNGTATVADTVYSSSRPGLGGLIGWSESADSIGWGVTASAIGGSGEYAIGADKTGVRGSATQIKASYGIPLSVDTTVTPYIGVRRSTLKVDSYTKSGELFPLTYGIVVQKQNDLLFGGTFSKRLTDDLTGSLSAGVIHGLMRDSGTVSVTSDMGAYSARMRDAKRTAGSLGAGLTYKLDKSSSIGINTGWTQRGLTDASVTTYSIGYTAGF